jgi:hypothetical protein
LQPDDLLGFVVTRRNKQWSFKRLSFLIPSKDLQTAARNKSTLVACPQVDWRCQPITISESGLDDQVELESGSLLYLNLPIEYPIEYPIVYQYITG